MLAESHAHQLVVDVVFVGLEERTAVADALKHHSDHVKHRYDEHCDGEDQSVFVVTHHIGVVHGEFHEEETQNETQSETA